MNAPVLTDPQSPERPIRFFHRGAVVEVTDVAPTRSVLDWLREDQRCTGTKEGCAEGDCGACTVVVGQIDGADQLQLQTVNACIQFLPMLDGKALFTVEDLSPATAAGVDELHPVQQALVNCHGSQCGFCTPGFVMSLWACRERHGAGGTRPSRQQLADELAGNLCRCTGYRPILDAGEQLFDGPYRSLDAAPVVTALRGLRDDPALHLQVGAGAAADLGEPARYWAPRDLGSLARLRADHPDARLLAGATDIGLWVNKQFRALPALIDLGRVAELRQIHTIGHELQVGAAASLEDAWAALAGHWPQLQDLWLRFASPPVRHAGTLGGNLANGSPIGDAAPVLMALDARLVLQHRDTRRECPLDSFYLGYMKNALKPGEFLHSVIVPLPRPATHMRAYKISKRFDSDISALCAGLAVDLDDGVVRAARLAFGGMAATVQRAQHAEAALIGQPWAEASIRSAMAALPTDFQPMTDLRASADYRAQVAQNLLLRWWFETRPAHALPASALSVWDREVTT
jgi:xanthine dehydrogenase small subunit